MKNSSSSASIRFAWSLKRRLLLLLLLLPLLLPLPLLMPLPLLPLPAPHSFRPPSTSFCNCRFTIRELLAIPPGQSAGFGNSIVRPSLPGRLNAGSIKPGWLVAASVYTWAREGKPPLLLLLLLLLLLAPVSGGCRDEEDGEGGEETATAVAGVGQGLLRCGLFDCMPCSRASSVVDIDSIASPSSLPLLLMPSDSNSSKKTMTGTP